MKTKETVLKKYRLTAECFYSEERHKSFIVENVRHAMDEFAEIRAKEVAKPLIEALEAWQAFDARIHTGIDAAKIHLSVKQILDEYKKQQ
jgi:hypothetical protein